MMSDRLRYRPQDIVGGYAEYVRQHVEEGWEPTFISLMFNPLGGSASVVADQMRYEAERLYGWMLTRRCRRPRTTPNYRKPIFLGCPDWPVPKYNRDSLHETSVNGGRHLHGIDLTPPWTRLVCTLSDFIAENQDKMAGPGRRLARVYAETITQTPENAVEYALKSLPRCRATSDDLIILPRSQKEVW